MIDDLEVKELTERMDAVRFPPAFFLKDDAAVIYSDHLVLEVPKELIGTKKKWPGEKYGIPDMIRQWRYELLPEGEGEPAQPVIETWHTEDGEEFTVIGLISESVTSHMQQYLYDFITRHLEGTTFRLYKPKRGDKKPSQIGVYVENRPVGVVAPMRKNKT